MPLDSLVKEPVDVGGEDQDAAMQPMEIESVWYNTHHAYIPLKARQGVTICSCIDFGNLSGAAGGCQRSTVDKSMAAVAAKLDSMQACKP